MRSSALRRFASVAAITAGCLVATSPAQAITWGEPDGEDHPYVVALLFERADGFYSCSGTLLSPTVVLTAGHCVEGAGEENLNTWVSNDPEPFAEREEDQSLTDFLVDEDSPFVLADSVEPHPSYDDFAAFPDTYDIGLVFLSDGSGFEDLETYGQLPELGFLEEQLGPRKSIQKRQVVVVGYGMQGTIPAFYQNDFERYQGVSSIIGFGRSSIQGSQTVQLTNNPGKGSGSGGTCFGDSGGPAFWIDPATGEETNIVVAVTSFGITGQCAGIDFSFRTDTEVAQDFVYGQID
jgi:hypothetical protein